MRGCSGDPADLLTTLVLVEAVAGLGGMIAYGYITYLMSDVLKGLALVKQDTAAQPVSTDSTH